MRLTKNQMARVVVQALYNLPELPSETDRRVVVRAQRGSVESLTKHHAMAMAALLSVKKVVLPVDRPAPGQGWYLHSGNTEFNEWRVRE